MSVNEFYIYVILDTRYKEESVYCGYSFSYRPIYIGKGKGDRKEFHLYESRLSDNSGNMLKNNVLNKMIRSGYDPIINIIEDGLSENISFELEKKLVHGIGRRDLGNGTLTNLTDGGEGQSGSVLFIKEGNPFYGKKHSKSTKSKLSKPINKLSIDGDVLNTYPSITNACDEMGYTESKLRDCLKGRSKTYKGFKWVYVNEEHRYDTQVHSRVDYRYISQVNLEGDEIKQWDSISNIVKSMEGIQKSNLIDCLRGRKNTCIGYIWKYIT